jgi:hypothetical protein
MIVRQDQAPGAVARRIGDNGADRHFSAVDAAVMARQVHAAYIVVDMRDPQMLLGGVRLGETAGEEAVRLLQSVETQRGFGTLMEHDPGLCERARASDLNLVRFGYPFRM